MTFSEQRPLLGVATSLLEDYGFAVAERILPELPEPAIVVESPDILALLLAGPSWSSVSTKIAHSQVALVNWAVPRDPTSRRWDLCVLVLIERELVADDDVIEAETVQADTSLTRTLVRPSLGAGDVDRVHAALRPLLPLTPRTRTDAPELAELLEERLRFRGIPDDVASGAVSSFMRSGSIEL